MGSGPEVTGKHGCESPAGSRTARGARGPRFQRAFGPRGAGQTRGQRRGTEARIQEAAAPAACRSRVGPPRRVTAQTPGDLRGSSEALGTGAGWVVHKAGHKRELQSSRSHIFWS